MDKNKCLYVDLPKISDEEMQHIVDIMSEQPLHVFAADAPQVVFTPDIVHCWECKHRPAREEGYMPMPPKDSEGYNDYTCPCICDDCYYNWMPDDDFFCGYGERKDGT